VGNTLEKISSSERELKRIKKELEHKKNELNYIKNEHQELKRKRSLLNDECTQLEKKLHYCDSLLKVNEPPQQSKNS
jgi:peptidoglycan hydrolase CwlO-like protein